jgi:hypothetical protein
MIAEPNAREKDGERDRVVVPGRASMARSSSSLSSSLGAERHELKSTLKTTMNPRKTNQLARAGLALSIAGLANLFLLGPLRYEPIRYMTLCSVIGLVVSFTALCLTPRKTALWGAVFGIIGTLYLPTVFLPVLTRSRGTQPGAAGNSRPGVQLTGL